MRYYNITIWVDKQSLFDALIKFDLSDLFSERIPYLNLSILTGSKKKPFFILDIDTLQVILMLIKLFTNKKIIKNILRGDSVNDFLLFIPLKDLQVPCREAKDHCFVLKDLNRVYLSVK